MKPTLEQIKERLIDIASEWSEGFDEFSSPKTELEDDQAQAILDMLIDAEEKTVLDNGRTIYYQPYTSAGAVARIKELEERNKFLELREKQRCFPDVFGNSCDQETIRTLTAQLEEMTRQRDALEYKITVLLSDVWHLKQNNRYQRGYHDGQQEKVCQITEMKDLIFILATRVEALTPQTYEKEFKQEVDIITGAKP